MNRRNCCQVISEMIQNIPVDNAELINDLEWNWDDASYKAPEETLQWQRTMETLIKHFPEPTEEWQFEVLSIFTTRSIDELKEMHEDKN